METETKPVATFDPASVEVKIGDTVVKGMQVDEEMQSKIDAAIRKAAATNTKRDVFKLEYFPLDKVITCNNKDFSIAKTFEANRSSLKHFGGRTKIYVKAELTLNNKGEAVGFKIIKDVENKNW